MDELRELYNAVTLSNRSSILKLNDHIANYPNNVEKLSALLLNVCCELMIIKFYICYFRLMLLLILLTGGLVYFVQSMKY